MPQMDEEFIRSLMEMRDWITGAYGDARSGISGMLGGEERRDPITVDPLVQPGRGDGITRAEDVRMPGPSPIAGTSHINIPIPQETEHFPGFESAGGGDLTPETIALIRQQAKGMTSPGGFTASPAQQPMQQAQPSGPQPPPGMVFPEEPYETGALRSGYVDSEPEPQRIPGGSLYENQYQGGGGEGGSVMATIREMLTPRSKFTETNGGGYLRNEIDPGNASKASVMLSALGDMGLDREKFETNKRQGDEQLAQTGPLREAQAQYYGQREDPIAGQIKALMSNERLQYDDNAMRALLQAQAALMLGDRGTAAALVYSLSGMIGGSGVISPEEVEKSSGGRLVMPGVTEITPGG